jgi:hypothetical protein
MNGIRLGVEEKLYLSRPRNNKMKLYISAELAYHNVSYSSEKRYYLANEEATWEYDEDYPWKEFAIKRDSKSINFKFGLEHRYKRFVMEASAGLGIIYSNVRYHKDVNEIIIPSQHFEDVLSPIFETDGKYFAPNIPLTFKIGYNF